MMPTMKVYLPPPVAERIKQAAAGLCLSRRDFVRAVLAAAAEELAKQDTEPAGEWVGREESARCI